MTDLSHIRRPDIDAIRSVVLSWRGPCAPPFSSAAAAVLILDLCDYVLSAERRATVSLNENNALRERLMEIDARWCAAARELGAARAEQERAKPLIEAAIRWAEDVDGSYEGLQNQLDTAVRTYEAAAALGEPQ